MKRQIATQGKRMAYDGTETKTVHGLMDRATGEMVRVKETMRVLQEEPYRNEETTYSMTLDKEWPLFDAGSPGMLAMAFHPTSGSNPERPVHDGFQPDSLVPVIATEVLTRSAKPLALDMDLPLTVPSYQAIEVRSGVVRRYEGMSEILETVSSFKGEIEAMPYPGEDFDWGKFHLVGLAMPGKPDDLPEDIAGRLVSSRVGGGRRALGVVPIPPEGMRMAFSPTLGLHEDGMLIVCVSDARLLPEGLVEALKKPEGPSPR